MAAPSGQVGYGRFSDASQPPFYVTFVNLMGLQSLDGANIPNRNFPPPHERFLMKIAIPFLIAASLACSGAAMASAELATKNKCNTCHALDKKGVGPSWKDVAAKNKGAKGADKALADVIVKGSKGGKYGKMPMPAQAGAAADAPALVKWILAQ
jgi:cytochrome c